jgi:hypothetical protein
MTRILFIILCLLPLIALAQYDTTYAIKYDNQIGVGIYQSKPSYTINIHQKKVSDPQQISNMSFQTLASYITGITLHYDKLSLFAGIKTAGDVEGQNRKGKTRSSQFNLGFTSVKLRLEASARFYKGFYDANSFAYLPEFTDSTPYYQDPELKSNSLKLKAFYFLNRKKRFSYGAAYINNVRQIRSAGSFIITSHVYNYKLTSSIPIIPEELRSYYHPWESIDKFNVTSVSLGIGYTHTFAIFKRIFLNILLTVGAEGSNVKLTGVDKKYNSWRTTLSSYDLRSSIGYNSKKIFISFISIVEGNNYKMPDIDISNEFLNGVVIIGYRFGIKKPNFYRKKE